MTSTPYIALEGLIGVGKSTLGKKWAENEGVHFLAERVNPLLLHCFYQDPKGYAFAFQMAMLRTRTWEYQCIRAEEKDRYSTFVMDRSAIGDAIFSIANALTGSIKPVELDAYMYDLGTTTEQFAANGISVLDSRWLPERIVYLYDSVQQCQKRVAIRANESESDIPQDYMELLDILHFNLLLLPKAKLPFVVNTLTWDQYSTTIPDLSRAHLFPRPTIRVVPSFDNASDITFDGIAIDTMFANGRLSINANNVTVVLRLNPSQEYIPPIVTNQNLIPIHWFSGSVRWVVANLAAKLTSRSTIYIVTSQQ
jgi:deoxyguanosine kinase